MRVSHVTEAVERVNNRGIDLEIARHDAECDCERDLRNPQRQTRHFEAAPREPAALVDESGVRVWR